MRLQLALNVADLDEAVEFYTKMFGVGPAKTKPGYANFAIDQPPLKLVLFEGAGETGIDQPPRRRDRDRRPRWSPPRPACPDEGLETTGVDDTVCCYAEKTETWVHGPDGTRWEWYVKHGDAEQIENVVIGARPGTGGSCCPS